jgi:hypothetical protein
VAEPSGCTTAEHSVPLVDDVRLDVVAWPCHTRTTEKPSERCEEASVHEHLRTHLERAFALTRDLVAHLDEPSLNLDLPQLPSNRIAGQLWCIVGARESYLQAINVGAWQGFTCSLITPQVKGAVLDALVVTQQQLTTIDFAGLNDVQLTLAFELLEHEIQHHGQLIRFVYGNALSFPESWNKRYTV